VCNFTDEERAFLNERYPFFTTEQHGIEWLAERKADGVFDAWREARVE
jgi:hypothetical protein